MLTKTIYFFFFLTNLTQTQTRNVNRKLLDNNKYYYTSKEHQSQSFPKTNLNVIIAIIIIMEEDM